LQNIRADAEWFREEGKLPAAFSCPKRVSPIIFRPVRKKQVTVTPACFSFLICVTLVSLLLMSESTRLLGATPAARPPFAKKVPLEIVTHVKRLFIGGEEITLDTNQTLLYEKFKARP